VPPGPDLATGLRTVPAAGPARPVSRPAERRATAFYNQTERPSPPDPAGGRRTTIVTVPENGLQRLRERLRHIPNEPGVYRFLDEAGAVLYVGKAKELRKRVSSYLRAGGPAVGRTAEMVARARDIEWVVTRNEQEALLVEDSFIKQSRPPFNVRLRDDKSYPYIEITLRDEWPRVRFMRGEHRLGNLYFGPYSSAKKVRELLDLIGRIFPYRKCQGLEPGRKSGSPCLQNFIKRSLGPCDHRCTREEYMEVIDEVIAFLRGQLREVERRIEAEMKSAAEAREFEKAALLRDRLAAVRHVAERQVARTEGAGDFDVIGLHQDEPGGNVQVFRVRDGALIDRQSFFLENTEGRERDRVLDEFLMEYYWTGNAVPPEVIVDVDGMDDLAAYAGLLGYLRSLSLVRDVEVESLQGSVVTLVLLVRGDRELLGRIAAFDGRLQPAAPAAEGAVPSADFTFQP